jgi:intracellular sulfur oxidation DsrE/DsrF family protein
MYLLVNGNPGKLMKILRLFICGIWFMSYSSVAFSSDDSPWGSATSSDDSYRPQKVLYDLSSGDEHALISILDRVSYLNTLYENDPFDMSIVIVVHGNAIQFFTREQYGMYRDIMHRAQSLTVGNPIEFRMCQAAARVQGLSPADIHGFVKMVPMADAEIIRLQTEEDYAYMR